MLYIRKRKKKCIQLPMSQNRKKKFDSHRTDQRYHPRRKGLGLDLLFFKMAAVLCLERKALGKIDLNQMSHRYVSGVLQNEPSTSAHLIDRCENVNYAG